MILIICGTRTLVAGPDGYGRVERGLDGAVKTSEFDVFRQPVTEVFSGANVMRDRKTKMAIGGADWLGECWAAAKKIPLRRFPANWSQFGRGAGPRRNGEMLDAGAEAVLALWDGRSTGTKDMIDQARARKIPVHIHYCR